MAEKLSIQIALEGGAEIEKQLAGIGEAGQKAFADITKSAEQAGGFKNIKPEEVTQKLKDMGVTGVDAIEKIQSAVKQAGRLEGLVQGITSVETAFSALAKAAPIIGSAIVAAFAAATKAAFAFADAVNKVSDEAAQLGVSIEKVDQFRRGLEQAGISAKGISAVLAQVKSDADKISLEQVKRDAQDVQKAIDRGVGGGQVAEQFKRLQQAAEQFTETGKAARAELVKMGEGVPGTTFKDVQELGVELAKLKGLGIDIKVSDDAVTQAQKILRGLAQMPDKALAAQIAMQRFSAAGPEIAAALRTGSLSVDQFVQQFATMTAEQEVAANKQRQIINQLSADWDRFKVAIGAPIAIAGIAGLTAVFDAVKGGIASTVQELEGIGRVLTLIGGQATGFSWGEIVATGGLASTRQELEAVGRLLTSIGGQATAFTWGEIVATGGLASTRQELELIGGAITGAWENAKNFTWGSLADVGTLEATKRELIAIGGVLDGLIQKLVRYLTVKGKGGGQQAPDLAGGPGFAGGGLLGGRGSGTSDSNLAWVSRGEYIMPAAAVRQSGVLAFLEALRRNGNIPGFAAGGSVGGSSNPIQIIEQLSQTLNQVIEQLRLISNANQTFTTNIGTDFNNFGSQMVAGLTGLWQKIRDNADRVTNDLQKVGQSLGNIVFSIARSLGGKASGGLLGGRGTGTSDSNLAWVSRGEHIMPARAVAQPGVLAFLEALRRSGGNLSAVLDGMGRFALGGMIRGPMPAFASGGLAGRMSNVTIQFPGLPAIGGLRASSDVVDQLHRAAALAQVRSGGRKPSRYS